MVGINDKKNHSVIFIGNSFNDKNINSDHKYDIYKRSAESSWIKSLVMHFTIPATDLPNRIALSFVPPVLGDKSRRVYVDFVGPCLAILSLAAVLHYGNAYKLQTATYKASPSEALLYYCSIAPTVCYILARVGGAALDFAEVIALLGYGLYGDLFTLAVSQLFDHERSNFAFFFFMLIFACPSVLRIALIILASIPRPAARLIVCSCITLFHLMFLIFVHFTYMHRTFVYGHGIHN